MPYVEVKDGKLIKQNPDGTVTERQVVERVVDETERSPKK